MSRQSRPRQRLVAAWRRFWFEPQETSTLALVRIAFGVLVLAWTLSLTGDIEPFFTESGVLPETAYVGEDAGAWSLLDVLQGELAATLVLAALTLASLCLIVGQDTRLVAVIVFVGVMSLERRNPFVFNAGDGLIRITAFYMMFAPLGASLSLDRWRRDREAFWQFPARAPWALRLMQVQLSALYLASVWTKLASDTWNAGIAVSLAVRLEDLQRFALPFGLADSELVSNLLSYGTMAMEAALGVLIWNRTLRPYVIGLGICMHLGIDLALRIGFFSFAVFVLYIAFVPPQTASAGLLVVREDVRPTKPPPPCRRTKGPKSRLALRRYTWST